MGRSMNCRRLMGYPMPRIAAKYSKSWSEASAAHLQHEKILVQWDYEPVEALQALLRERDPGDRRAIGGAPQVVKIYPFARTSPIVVRTGKGQHFLLGRRLFRWESTEYPILDMSTRARRDSTTLRPRFVTSCIASECDHLIGEMPARHS
jgi:hypothetical protein